MIIFYVLVLVGIGDLWFKGHFMNDNRQPQESSKPECLIERRCQEKQIQYHLLPPWTFFPHAIVLSLMMGLVMEEKLYMQSFCPLHTWAHALWLLTTPQENISIATVTIIEEGEAEKLSRSRRSPWTPVQVWIKTQVWGALNPVFSQLPPPSKEPRATVPIAQLT